MGGFPTARSMQVFHGEVAYIDPDWRSRLAAIGLSNDADWTTLQSDEAVSASFHTTANFRFTLADGESVYFKRYVYRKPRWKHWLQPSKAAVEATGLQELAQLGIPTLQVIAFGERRWLGILRAAFIVTRGIANTRQLDQYLAQHWRTLPYQEKQDILQQLQPQLIEQLQKAHNNGFFHWDLKLRNLLLQENNGKMTLIWIDCPRSRRLAPNHTRGVMTDLTAMARVGIRVLTPGQRLRFLLHYCSGDRQRARSLYRDIADRFRNNPPRPLWHLLAKDDPIRVAELKKWGRS